jgi:hypothetical protein
MPRLCMYCSHYSGYAVCSHPELVDRVNGSDADCHAMREVRVGAGPNKPPGVCGWEGLLWEGAVAVKSDKA